MFLGAAGRVSYIEQLRRIRGWVLAAMVLAAMLALPGPASADYSTRVVGGSATTTATYPWQAALVYDSRFGSNVQQFCGGVLVAPRIVLTAAHCVIDTDPDGLLALDGPKLDPNDVDVIIGRTTLSAGGGARLDAQATYVEPAYNTSNGSNDVGYIVLTSAPSATLLKLAGPTETALWTPGSPTQVTGYGSTSSGGGGSDTLQVATVPIISDATCGSAAVYGSYFFPSSMVCAGSLAGGVDSCQGDSGGPLQAPAAGGIFRLVGLVSFGDGCAQPNKPGVYARVGAGAPGTLQGIVVNQLAAIEAAQGLPHTDVVGSGAVPPGTTTTTVKKRRCKKGRRLVKRHGKKKCVKKHHHRR
ncbi:MAG: serine protease [Solirubrobacterales bacterium]